MPANLRSQPYNVFYQEEYYYFQTDQGLLYSCAFRDITTNLTPRMGASGIQVHDFEFFPVDMEPNTKKFPDNRIAATVVDLMQTYIEDELEILIYLCDASDGRARERQILFSKWHRNISDIIDHTPVKIAMENTTVYGGIFTRKNFLYTDMLKSELIDKASGLIVEKSER